MINRAESEALHTAEKLKERGNVYMRAGKLELARSAYVKARKSLTDVLLSKHEWSRNVAASCSSNAALMSLRLQEFTLVVKHTDDGIHVLSLGSTVRKGPLLVKLRLRRSRALVALKRFDEAEADIRAALRFRPDSTVLKQELHEIRKAKRAAERDVVFERMAGGLRGYSARGLIQTRAGESLVDCDLFQKVEDMKARGTQLLRSGDLQGARQTYLDAKAVLSEELLEGNRSARRLGATCCSNAALVGLRLKAFQDVVGDATAGLELLYRGSICVPPKCPDNSIDLCVKLYLRRGRARAALQETESAERDFSEGLRLQPENAVLKKELAVVRQPSDTQLSRNMLRGLRDYSTERAARKFAPKKDRRLQEDEDSDDEAEEAEGEN